jgi:hypothetical protein
MAGVVNGLAGDEAGAGYIERRDRDGETGLLSSSGKRLLGYEPQTEFEDGLKNVHGWFAESWGDMRGGGEF